MAEKSGVAAVLDDLPADRLKPALADAHQLSLLPDDLKGRQRIEAARAAGPGRPKGAKNKRTADFADFILTQFSSPLVFMAQTFSRPVQALADELGCTKEDAFKLQLTAARELAPFVHQKQPVAVNVDSSGVIRLTIESGIPAGSTPGSSVDGSIVIETQALAITADDENEENQ